MNAIVIVDKNWGIGNGGKLLAHLPGDLKYFKEKTIGNTIIIGRETFVGMGSKLLPGRETIVLSTKEDFNPGCLVCSSLDDTFKNIAGKEPETLFVAGGESVYRLFLPYCNKIFVTKINAAFEADRYFPNLDANPDEFSVTRQSDMICENSIEYRFFEYNRTK